MAELTCEVLVKAEPSTIYALLTEPGRQSWLGTNVEFDPRPGGIYKVSVGGDHPALGTFVNVTPNEQVVFTFGWDEPGHPIPAGSTEVSITLIPSGDETLVRLVHRGLPEDAVTDHTQGWNHFLERIAIVATGGELPD